MLRFTPIGLGFLLLGLAVFALAAFQGVTVATHVFTDVPSNAFYHEDAATIKKLNVTTGCNPPTGNLYCPHDDVSRGEMASFLARTAGLYGAIYQQITPGATLVGLDTFAPTPILGDVITVPADCVLLMSATADWDDNGTGTGLQLWWYVDDTVVSGGYWGDGTGTGTPQFASATGATVLAGGEDYVVQLRANIQSAPPNGSVDILRSGFFAICVPFDGAGNVIDA